MRKDALFEQGLQRTSVEGVLNHICEPRPHFRLVAVAYGVNQQFAQRPALELHFSEHVEDLAAERLARLRQLFEQPAVNVAFAGFLGDEVPEMANLGLSDR